MLGQDVRTNAAALRSRIGVLPQETALYDEVTALQNLRFAAALYGIRRPDTRIDFGLACGLPGRTGGFLGRAGAVWFPTFQCTRIGTLSA